MSRKTAKSTLTMEEYQKAMQGIYSSSINPSTLDEAPMAYKRLEDIIDVIRDSVDVIEVLKPIYNFKASEAEPLWMQNKKIKKGGENANDSSD